MLALYRRVDDVRSGPGSCLGMFAAALAPASGRLLNVAGVLIYSQGLALVVLTLPVDVSRSTRPDWRASGILGIRYVQGMETMPMGERFIILRKSRRAVNKSSEETNLAVWDADNACSVGRVRYP